MKKRMLSMLLAIVMVVGMLPVEALAVDTVHTCGGDCLVCQLADSINALPAADEITAENAAAVIDAIHAIDRIKVELTDDEYDELLTLVDQGENEAGAGLGVPVRYMEAVEAIRAFGGNTLAITKKFVNYDGGVPEGAEVRFTITGDNGYAQTLTLTDMPYVPNSLSADEDFYAATEDGWVYTYILPNGTYTIEETQDFGADTVLYYVNGEETENSAQITLGAEENCTVEVWNSWRPAVADIKGTPYATLAAAISAAQDGDIVTMLQKVELNEPLIIPNSITLDLNGKTVEVWAHNISAEKDLTIKDTSTEGEGQLTVSAFTTFFQVGGNLTVNGGSISCSGSTAAIQVTGDLTITGGEVYGSASASNVIVVRDLTMTGGKLTASSGSGQALVIKGQLGQGIKVESGALNSGNVVLVYAPEEGGEGGEEPGAPGEDDENVIEIDTADELIAFAKRVNRGETKLDAKLAADIDLSGNALARIAVESTNVMIGDSEANAYTGTFDGAGHTLTVNYDVSDDYVAPFRYVNGATIKNLTVEGTIETSEKFAAGLIGSARGNTTLENCISAVKITSAVTGDGTHGGLVGVNETDKSSLTLTNCAFVGLMNGEDTDSNGGLVGWTHGPVVMTNCYVAADFGTSSNNSNTFVRNDSPSVTLNNCYYVTAYGGTREGIPIDADAVASGELTYKLNGSSSVDPVWKQDLGEDGDAYPNFNGAVVYKDGETYTNDESAAYDIIVDEDIENGTVESDKAEALEGETVTLTITPAKGYMLKSLTVTDANDKAVEVTDYTFIMPDGDVTVSATFAQPVAEINGTTYATLQAAISAAQSNDTIKLLQDVRFDNSLSIPNSITLDLNGKKIDVRSSVVADHNLTVVDTSAAGGGELSASVGINVSGDLTVTGGKVASEGSDGYIDVDHNLNLSGGEVVSTGEFAYVRIGGALNMSGGSLTAENWNGKAMTIRGGMNLSKGAQILQGDLNGNKVVFGVRPYYITGDFNGWDPAIADAMTGQEDGTWTFTLTAKTGSFNILDRQGHWSEINKFGFANLGTYVQNGVSAQLIDKSVAPDVVAPDVYDINYNASYAEGDITVVFNPEAKTILLTWQETEIGEMNRPAQLQLGENKAIRAEGDGSYYYTWTAPSDGVLTLGISSTTGGWVYTINNLTSYAYDDTQWSDSDPVVNPAVIEVAAGDELQIVVNTYDPSDYWTTPAGTVTVTASFAEPVARIFGTSYTTLDAAFAAAQHGDVVRLLKDIELDETLTISKSGKPSISLNLMGHDLTVTDDAYGIYIYDTELGIADTVGEGSLTAKATGEDSIGIYVENGDLWTNSSVINAVGGRYGIYVDEGSMTVESGTVTGEATGTVYGDGISVRDGSAAFNGGTVTGIGKDYGLFVSSGSMTVTGGTITGTATGKGYGYGIYCSGDPNNEDALAIANGTVTGTGFSGGISVSYADLIVNSGVVTGTATGNEYASGIEVRYGSMIVNGGVVIGKVIGEVILEDGLGIAVYGNTTDLIQLKNGLSVLQPEGGVIASYDRPCVDGDEIVGYETHVTVMVGDTPAREVEIAKIGTEIRPAQLQLGMNSVKRAEGDDDYYYTWTAPGDGVLSLEFYGTPGWSYSINGGWEYSSGDDDVRSTAEVEVNAGDTVQIAVNTCDPIYGQIPEGTVEVFAIFNSDLAIGGVPITPENSAGDNWSFDFVTNTLTLNGYTYEGGAIGIEYRKLEPLHLVLVGDSTITIDRNDGIRAGNADLIVSGSGSLTVNSSGNGVYVWGLTMNGGTLDVTAASRSIPAPSDGRGIIMLQRCAVQTRDALVMNGGTLTANSDGTGIKVMGNLTMNGGTLNAEGTGRFQNGIEVMGYLTMSGGTLNAKGDNCGVTVYKDMTMSGGTLNAEGTVSSGCGVSWGLTMNGGTLHAKGSTTGISTGVNGLTINDGTLISDGIVRSAAGITISDALTVCEPENYTIAIEEINYIKYAVIQNGDAAADRVFIGKAYSVTANTVTNGTVTADKAEALEGETVTLTVTPATYYELDWLTVTDANGNVIAVDNNSFIMPGRNVTVSAAFKVSYVAEIVGGDRYTTLDAAVSAAAPGATIKLLKNISRRNDLLITKEITLDLNGKSIQRSSGAIEVGTGGNLTVIDTATGGSIAGGVEVSGGICTISGGTILGYFNYGIAINSGICTITGGTIDGGYASLLVGGGTVNIEGGRVCNGATGVNISGGTVNIKGGTVEDNIDVTGGRCIISAGMLGGQISATQNDFVSVTGGTFVHDPEDYVAEGYESVKNGDVWEVQKLPVHPITIVETANGTVTANLSAAYRGQRITLTVTPEEGYLLESLTIEFAHGRITPLANSFVMPNSEVTITATFAKVEAKIGTTGYLTLEEALNKVTAGQTIVLQKDADIDLLLLSDITLDLGGHTLTAGSVAVFNGASIIDSTNGDGLLVTDKQQLILPENNGALPIWTGNGFVFVTLDFNKTMIGSNKYVFQPLFKDTEIHALLDDTAVEVWVDWTKGDTYGTHKFVYSKEMTDTFLESYNAENGKYGKMFTIKLNGIEAFEDLWVYGVVSGEQGVCFKAERMELK